MLTSPRLPQLPGTQADHERDFRSNRCHRIWVSPALLPEATDLVSPENARFSVLGALGVLVVRFLKGNHQGTKNAKITKDQQRIAHFHRWWRVNGRMSSSRENPPKRSHFGWLWPSNPTSTVF
jgi:hypothetical protein